MRPILIGFLNSTVTYFLIDKNSLGLKLKSASVLLENLLKRPPHQQSDAFTTSTTTTTLTTEEATEPTFVGLLYNK